MNANDILKAQISSLQTENENLKKELAEIETDNMIKMAHIIWTFGSEVEKGVREITLSQANQPPANLECVIVTRIEQDPQTQLNSITFTLLSADGKMFHEYQAERARLKKRTNKLSSTS